MVIKTLSNDGSISLQEMKEDQRLKEDQPLRMHVLYSVSKET